MPLGDVDNSATASDQGSVSVSNSATDDENQANLSDDTDGLQWGIKLDSCLQPVDIASNLSEFLKMSSLILLPLKATNLSRL